MKLIAIAQQLTGEYGTVTAGQEFECPDDVAKQLLSAGSVRKPGPPRVLYETKVIVPEAPEVSARLPFRNVSVSHEEPAQLASAGDPVLPVADVLTEGAADPGRRRGRGRPGSGQRLPDPADSH